MPPARARMLVLLAAIAVAPVLLPGAILYMDNPSHLIEVIELQRILRTDLWFSGWGDLANAGMGVNQVNAPLVWTAVAVAGSLFGDPVGPYVVGILLSNLVFAWGASRFFQRWLPTEAAWIAAVIAALAPHDLWGYAGAAGGMWPQRMAQGLLFAGLGYTGRVTVGKLGAWLALVLLVHSYSGMQAAGVIGLAILFELGHRRWRDAGVRITGAVVGAAIAAPFWVPLLWTGIRPDFAGDIRFWALGDSLAEIFLPLDPVVLNNPLKWTWIGGPLGFAWSAVFLPGLWVCWKRRKDLTERLRPLTVVPGSALPAMLAILLAVVVVIVPLTLTEAFGPNPWRHLTTVRTVLAGFAGYGLHVWIREERRPWLDAALLLVALAVAGSGVRAMPLTVKPVTAAQVGELRDTWAELAAANPAGRVYHEATSTRDLGPPTLEFSEIGAMIAAEHGLPMVGTWYTISNVATEPFLRSTRGLLFGRDADVYYKSPKLFLSRVDDYRVGAFVTVEPRLQSFLARFTEFRQVGGHGPFAAFVLTTPLPGPIDCPDDLGCTDVKEATTRVEATITGPVTAERELPLRLTWHPWWTATLDGQPIPIRREPRAARLMVMLPPGEGTRTLVVQWADPTRWTGWIGLAGLLFAATAWRRGGMPS